MSTPMPAGAVSPNLPSSAKGLGGPFPRLPASISADPSLLTYYVATSILLGPFFLFALIPLYFRYHTLRYQVDEEGITMRWGILFRKEISLNYARIQDIHLSSNVVERWLGLAKIQVQTASGSASAEMTIEGLKNTQEIRDFLYSRMRGARTAGSGHTTEPVGEQKAKGDLAEVLEQIASEVRAIRDEMTRPSSDGSR